MLSQNREAMLGATGRMLGINPKFQGILDKRRKQVLTTGKPCHGAMQMETPIGLREFIYTFALFSHQTQAQSRRVVICTARDVTERNSARLQAAVFLQETQESRRDLAHKCQELAEANVRLESANAQLHELAMRDGLTGLLNHRALQERLDEEFKRAVRHDLPLALLLLDIDHFKSYNDTFGHPAGDAALQSVAECLRQFTRETDTSARCGGEEFFVVLPQTDMEGALTMAERIRQGIEHCMQAERSLTVSIGAAVRQAQMDSASLLINSADAALYRAKAAGRNQIRN